MRVRDATLSCDGKKNRARVSKDKGRARPKPRRKTSLRAHPRSNPRRALGDEPEISAIARLTDGPGATQTRFIVVGYWFLNRLAAGIPKSLTGGDQSRQNGIVNSDL